jgi:hypothetical protein
MMIICWQADFTYLPNCYEYFWGVVVVVGWLWFVLQILWFQ